MKLIVAPEICRQFPDLHIGIVMGTGLQNGQANAEVTALTEAAATQVRAALTLESLAQHPFIVAWRETYRRFKSKPSDFRPTAEALLRRVLRGEPIPSISTVVDLYLAVQAEWYLPIGGYDSTRITGDIRLRFSPGNEPCLPIGATTEELTYAGEVVYADDEKILTRRWNYRDCDAAKITPESHTIALFCEAALSEIPADAVTRCTERLASDLQRFCGGTVKHAFVTAEQPELDLAV